MAKGGGFGLFRGVRRIGLKLFPKDVEPSVRTYSNAIAYKVSLLAQDIDRSHRDARIVRHGMSYQLVGGQPGRKLDRQAAGRLVLSALANPEPGRVELPLEVDPPSVTVAQLRPVRARAMRVVSAPVTLRIGIANFVVPPKRLAAMLRVPSGGSSDLAFGGAAANAYFHTLDRDVSSPPKNAGFAVDGGGAISVTPAKEGVALDVPKTAAGLLAAAQRRAVSRCADRGREVPAAALDRRGEGDGDQRPRRVVRDDLRRHRQPHPQRAARRQADRRQADRARCDVLVQRRDR